jgi:TRAP transporter 4TM/12TM fusion protein
MREIECTEVSTFRVLIGFDRVVQVVLSVAIVFAGALFILGIERYCGVTVFKEQYCGAFLAASLCLVFMSVRPTKQAASNKVPWYDYSIAAIGLATGLYITVKYPELVFKMGYITTPTVVFGVFFILLTLEAIRRLQGWPMVILVLVFILYGRFANFFPGVLNLSATSMPRLISYLYLDPDNMLWLAGIAATIALAFVFFGQLLFVFKGTAFIRDFSFALLGQFRGAPAKVAVVASSLFGTISGGAAINVMVTGSFTIPMMKSSGYRPHTAGGIEAVASSGGQIMPPVMGIAAFLIAEFLRISYAQVALAALIPALLYYFAVFVQIDLDAGKFKIKGLKPEERPQLRHTLRESWLFVMPMAILVYFLFILRFDAATAGMIASLLAIVVIIISKENRTQFWKKLLDAIEKTIRTMLVVTVILTGAGFIVAISSITGLGSVFSILLVEIAGGNVVALLVIAAIGCMILGMGMPTMAAYVLVAILVAPALTEMGIMPLAAHLLILYFAIVSNFTPPVALAAYTAAALAGAGSMSTALEGMRLGILAYIMPFLFVFCPALILAGNVAQIAVAIFSVVVGTVFLGFSLCGYLFHALRWPKRLLALVIAVGFFFPLVSHVSLGLVSYVIGTSLAIALIATEWRRKVALVNLGNHD